MGARAAKASGSALGLSCALCPASSGPVSPEPDPEPGAAQCVTREGLETAAVPPTLQGKKSTKTFGENFSVNWVVT